MKKIISILLVSVTLLSALMLAGCGKNDGGSKDASEKLNLGLGIVAYIDNINNAEGTKNGQGEAASTAAAVLLDKDGKIVKCTIDSLDFNLGFNSKGECVAINEFKTKHDMGADYNMVAYGGAKKEWFEQVDAFEKVVTGKTIDEVKALIATEGKGNDDVVNAGCTIIIADFVSAIEKAVKNAKASEAVKDDALNIGITATQTATDAKDKVVGTNEVEVTVCAIASKDGKAVAAATDSFQSKLTFDSKGIATVTGKTAVSTKIELGDNYGMVEYGGAKSEWYQQAAEFDKLLIGKNADEIGALSTNEGKGNEDVINAGCTVYVSDMVKAAQKAAK